LPRPVRSHSADRGPLENHLAGLRGGNSRAGRLGRIVVVLVGHHGERRGGVCPHQVGVGVIQRVPAAALGDRRPVLVVDVVGPVALTGPEPRRGVAAAVVVDVVAGMGDQVEVVALADPRVGVENVLPPGGAGHMCDGQFGDPVGHRGRGSGAPDRRAVAQCGEGVVQRPGRGQPVGVYLDRPVARRGRRHGAPPDDVGESGVAGDHPADRRRADALRIGDHRGVPAAGVGDGDAGPEHHPVSQGVATHDAVPERQQVGCDGIGPTSR